MTRKSSNIFGLLKISLVLFVFGFIFSINIHHTQAATKTWTGATSAAWGTSTNWTGGTPVAGDDLVFPSSASNKTMTNAITAATSFNSIDFSGSGYSVTGNSITLGTPTLTSSCGAVTSICDSSTGGNSMALAIIFTAVKTMNVSNSGETLSLITGVKSGTSGGITKTGSGILFISGTNTFTGAVVISVGTLKNGSATGTGSTGGGVTVSSGAVWDLNGTAVGAEATSINGTGISSGGAIINSGGTASLSGVITLAGPASIVGGSGLINLTGTPASGTNAITLGGGVGGSWNKVIAGARNIIKEGAGTWTLSGTNTYTGTTTISAGILNANTTSALGNGTNAGNTLIFNGGTLQAAGTITSPSARGVTLTSTALIDTNGQNISFAGAVGSAGGITKSGTGTLTLAAATTLGNALTISAGTVTVTSSLSGTSMSIATGATFDHESVAAVSFSSLAVAGTLSGAGTGPITVTGDVVCGATCGSINLTANLFTQDVGANQTFGTNVASDATPWTFYGLKFSNSNSASHTITIPTTATGSITATLGITVGDTGDTYPTVLNAGNRLWTLSGTGTSIGNAFPTIEGRAPTTETVSPSTSHQINFDSTPTNGDLLIAVAGFNGNPTTTWPVGWNLLSSSTYSTSTKQEIYYKIAASDSSSISVTTSTSDLMVARTWRFGVGEFQGVPQVGTSATGSSTTPDSPSVTASWGSDSNYFISIYSGTRNLTTSVYPTNYNIANGSMYSYTGTASTAEVMGYAGRQYVSATDNPSAFTKSGSYPWVADTIVVRGYPVNSDVMTINSTPSNGSSSITGNTSTFLYTGNAATIACTDASYYNLQLEPATSGSANRQALCHASGATLNVGNDLTIGSGTGAGASGAANDPTINVTRNIIISSGATLVSTGNTLSVGGAFTNNGTFTHNSGKLSFTGTSGTITVPTNATYYDLDFSPASGSPTFKVALNWYSVGGTWLYRKAITIDHTKVSNLGGETYVNFPILISFTDTNVKNSALSNGNDILFTTSDGMTKLNHEIEKYNSGTGELEAWVNVGAGGLSNSVDTTFYMYYGNASASNQQNVTGTWNTNYKGVWHLANGGNTLTSVDSTGANNGTNSGTTSTTGQIDGATHFNGTSDYVNAGTNSSLNITGNLTISAWVNTDSGYGGGQKGRIVDNDGSGDSTGYSFLTTNDTTNNVANGLAFGTTTTWCHSTANIVSSGVLQQDTVIYNSGTDTAYFYVNGALASTVSSCLTSNPLSSSSNSFYIGNNSANTRQFAGTLDEIEISNSNRSADWIATEYNNQNNPSTFYKTISSQQDSTSASTSPITINNNLTVNGGTFLSGGDVTVSGGNATGSGNINMTSGTFTISGTGNMSSSGATWIFNNFTIGTSSIITATNQNLEILGDLTNNGSFTNSGGTVIFYPASASGISNIGGTNGITFNNFTVAAADGAGKTITFKNGNTYVFAGSLNLAGQNGTPLSLTSDSPGSQWTITSTGTSSLSYVSVKDSACSGSNVIALGETDYNLGNNGTCWAYVYRGGSFVSTPIDGGSGGGSVSGGTGEGGGTGGSSGSGGGSTGGGTGQSGGGASP